MTRKVSRRTIIAGLGATGLAPLVARADTKSMFAGKAVRLVVEYQAGSPPDLVGRLIAPRLADMLGGTFIVDPRPGAGGRIAAQVVAGAPADGTTLLLMTASQTVIAMTDPDVRYNLLKDFQFVSMVAEYPFFVFTSGKSEYKMLAALLDGARRKPGKITYASSGVGTTTHLAMEMLLKQAGVTMVQAPYPGGPQMIADAENGVVDCSLANLGAVKGLAEAGDVRLLAATSKERDPLAPTIPTVAETLPGYDVTTWIALAAPAGMPAQIVDALNVAARKAMAEPEIRERLTSVGFSPATNTPDEMRARVAADIAKWSPFGTLLR
jgi:tripartite-type tricarboxylate transporter receptor subunit TctC